MKHIALIATAIVMLACGQIQKGTEMNKDFLQLATDRYSVRSFSSTTVGQDVIDLILKAGQVAPTAVNSQPQKIYVVRSASGMEKMEALSPCMYGAPHCFIFCYNDENVIPRGENDNYGEMDVTIVLTHMMLEAANLGVGTCPVGRFDRDKLSSEFNLPENEHPILVMPFGYAASDAKPSDRHFSYRPVTETVGYL